MIYRLCTGGDDGTVRLWEVMSGKCVRVWNFNNNNNNNNDNNNNNNNKDT